VNEEERIKSEAIMKFGYNFSQYVRELNKELWDKAVDFAATMTKVQGVQFGKGEEER
jgi:hypothetical protein